MFLYNEDKLMLRSVNELDANSSKLLLSFQILLRVATDFIQLISIAVGTTQLPTYNTIDL
jgi:hypothetical protein